jgi:N-acetylglucosaminyl-diphospho-decaprenol L-rhamnosyltransferase
LNAEEKIIDENSGRPSVDIIIVNWNSGELLKDCIQSINSAINNSFDLKRVVIVDNKSSDNSIEFSINHNLPLFLIKNEENLGFAKACNQGASGSKADFLLFLNPDTVLFKDSLSEPAKFLAGNPKVGIVGVQMINDAREISRNCARFPTPFRMVYTSFGLDKIFPAIFPGHFMSEWDHLSDRQVDQVMGSFFMIRRNLFDRLKGYDERFFVYFEDLDLAIRAKKSGFGSFYLSTAQIYHKGGGTTESVKAMRLALILRSKLIYCKKHFSKASYYIIFCVTILIEPVTRLIDCLLKGRAGEMKEILKGYQILIRKLSD